MADIPLNHFVRQAYTITSTPSAYYVAPFSRAAIVLGAYASNVTPNDVTVTVSISGVGGEGLKAITVPPKPQYDYAKNILVAGNDTTNLAPARIVLEEYDAFIMSCSTPGAVVLNLNLLETVNTVE